MVYSGIEFGQYFELKGNIMRLNIKFLNHKYIYCFDLSICYTGDSGCQNILVALTPAVRMILSIVQMQFIFLNTKDFEMGRHKVIARFGLMHMVATNLCEWLYVLVEETKHEIHHIPHGHDGEWIKQFCF